MMGFSVSVDLLDAFDEWGPEKVITVSDQKTGMKGVLVLDNTARGMGKGGTRMSASLTVTEVMRLARTMTWKWAAADLFFGGAKAGILGDPRSPDKEAILRAFARRLSNEIPREYVLGLDMGLAEEDAAIFLDELGDRGSVIGLPGELGGLPYDQLGLTGFGVAEAADSTADVLGLSLKGARVVVQGFGAVGFAAAKRFVEIGAHVVATSTSRGALVDPDGLDIGRLIELRRDFGDDCVLHYGKPHTAVGSELLVDADVLVPCALQDVITADIARSTTAKFVVEGANMPTTPDAKTVLHDRGIMIVPDFIANSGGIVGGAFAMDARYSPFRPEVGRIFDAVSSTLRKNAATTVERAMDDQTTAHEAALALAMSRVRAAMDLRRQTKGSR